MATTSIPRTQTSEDLGDPVTGPYEGYPLKATEIQAIRHRDSYGGIFRQMDVPRLLEHITWLEDKLEQAREQRDTLQERFDVLTRPIE